MKFLLGCAIWAYKGWVGELFPPGTRSSEFLYHYSRRFSTVEGNTTFYAIPDSETIARWKLETPDNFEFCLKLPKEYTHQGLLKNSISGALSFLEKMQPLGHKLGPIFAQLPPTYSPNLIEDLTGFLEMWPREAKLAIEVRHPDWFKAPHIEQLNILLKEFQVGRVLLDTRPVYSRSEDANLQNYRRKPQVPVEPVLTADFTFIRFISHPEASVNQAFLKYWVSVIEQWVKQGKNIYFFVHCPLDETVPKTARSFQKLLEENNIPIPPLPWNLLDNPPIQLSLF
jgi:uncharacterized protein YecE (DUF72 family)